MPAGHRDADALDFAAQLTRAADEMRKKSTHTNTVKEVDPASVEMLRAEVDKLRAILIEIGNAVEAEMKRRA